MKKKLLISLIAVVLVLSVSVGVLAACNNKKDDNNSGSSDAYVDLRVNFDSIIAAASGGGASSVSVDLDLTIADQEDHSDDDYYEFYAEELNGFYETFVAAKAQEDVDAKYAGMAIAEAKLLESGVLVPTTSQGGVYAITRVAPGMGSAALWGNDSNRVENLLVTNELIKAADRDTLKALYSHVKGTGLYDDLAIAYLNTLGYTLKDSYNIAYSTDPRTWDITSTYRASDTEKIVHTFDNLLAYDNEGRAMGMLADNLTISEDGLKYKFHIREGVKWVDKDGREYADVQADDFVYGMKRILEKSLLRGLLFGVLDGAQEYAAGGADRDFSHVGVKAIDKYTVEYTLAEPTSFFITMFNYNIFAPACREYAESTEDYGTSPDKILYCGPYLVENYTPNNKIVFKANPTYWNKNAVRIKTYTWTSYKENQDVTKTYVDAKAGTIDGAGLNATTVALAKTDKLWDYVYVSGTDATTYCFFLNLDRQAFTNDQFDSLDSSKTEAQKALAQAALKNDNFRMAFARGLDRASYNAQEVGEDVKLFSLQNGYTPGNFVQLGKDVTIDINGVPTTFAKGTYYGAIVQAQINADLGDKAMKVWDPAAEGGSGSSAGFDGWYDADIAAYYLDLAIAELEAELHVTIDANNPIILDYPCWDYATYRTRAEAFARSMNTLFGGKVKINLYFDQDSDAWLTAGYYAEAGEECCYDLYDCSGWGPDYGDPRTYLNTMLPIDGDMIKMLGIY